MVSSRFAKAAGMAACLALLASPAAAFVGSALPSSLQLKSPASFVAQQNSLPVTSMLRKAQQTARQQPAGGVSMELIGKRYFLWKIAEGAFDKMVWVGKMVALMLANVVEKLFERTVTNVRLKALKNDLQGIRSMSTTAAVPSPTKSTPKKAVKDLQNINAVQELNKLSHPPGAVKEGTQTTNGNAIDAPTINTESLFAFLMVAVPLTGALVNLFSSDKVIDSLSVSAATACFLIMMVDLAADTPSTTLTLNIRKSIPSTVRRFLSPR